MDGLGDDRVRELRDQLRRDRFPFRPLETDEEPAVHVAGGEGHLVDRRVGRSPPGDLLAVVLGQGRQRAVESAECGIAIAGDDPPDAPLALVQQDPSKLTDVPVPVSHQDVDQAGAKVVARVDVLVAAAVEPLEEGERLLLLLDPRKAVLDPLFHQPEHPGEGSSVLAESWIVGHHHQLGRRVEDAGRLEERRDHQRAAGKIRAGHVLGEPADQSPARIWIENAGRILVDRSERPGASVGAFEAQLGRLQPAALTLGKQPAVKRRQIEDVDFDGRVPGLPPVGAQEQAAEPSGLVAGAGNDGDRSRWLDLGGGRGSCRQEDRDDQC